MRLIISGRAGLQALRQGQGRLHHQGRDGEAVQEPVEGADRQGLRQVRLGRRRSAQLRRVPENDDKGEVKRRSQRTKRPAPFPGKRRPRSKKNENLLKENKKNFF